MQCHLSAANEPIALQLKNLLNCFAHKYQKCTQIHLNLGKSVIFVFKMN